MRIEPAGRIFWFGRARERAKRGPQLTFFEPEIVELNQPRRGVAGPKSLVTADLYLFAHALDNHELHGKERALHIYFKLLKRIARVPVDLKTLAKYYAIRDAHEIVHSYMLTKDGKRKIAVPVIRPEDEERYGVRVHGCLDIGTLLASVYRIVGMPADVLREKTHTYVIFHETLPGNRLGKRWKMDALNPRKIVEYGEDEHAAVEARIAHGLAAMGLDHGHIGINTFKDFARYGEAHEKQRLQETFRALRALKSRGR